MGSHRMIWVAWVVCLIFSMPADAHQCNLTATKEETEECDFRPLCFACINSKGCEFDDTIGACLPASNSSEAADKTYCAESDSKCKECVPNEKCIGGNGCQCPLICSNLETLQKSCARSRADESSSVDDASASSSSIASAVSDGSDQFIKISAVVIGVTIGLVIAQLVAMRRRDNRDRQRYMASYHRQWSPSSSSSSDSNVLGLEGWTEHRIQNTPRLSRLGTPLAKIKKPQIDNGNVESKVSTINE